MKNLCTSLLLLALFVCVLPISASAADSQDRIAANLEKNGIIAGALGLRPPKPVTVIEDPVGDLFEPLPPDWKIENRAVMDLVAVEAGSNGVETPLVLSFSPKTHMNRIQGAVFLDIDRNVETGFAPVFFPRGGGRLVVPQGVDVVIGLWDFPRTGSVSVSRFNRDGITYLPVSIEASRLIMTIPNLAMGNLGRGVATIFTLFADEYGIQDIAPNHGTGLIRDTGRLRVSPGSSVLVSDLSRDPKFDFTAVIDQDDLGFDTARVWLDNGNSITAIVEANLTKALLIPGRGERAGKVFSFPYPINSLAPGRHEMTVIAISPDAFMVDEVVYDVVRQISPPPLPTPPRQ